MIGLVFAIAIGRQSLVYIRCDVVLSVILFISTGNRWKEDECL